ncbi:hypothetical protein [Calycomorphotria hydatis]|uniref:Uncharacterized protein n=1 Tax=Calycomorphotria hydatis TaxID=2528027 RepID=A0A517T8T6_9PLAN|nr:hypothetical protein [Calycomorphotria hydatis]QDT64773.1 hypothetical protein V22_20140 [Calycomorphotria hydatis]
MLKNIIALAVVVSVFSLTASANADGWSWKNIFGGQDYFGSSGEYLGCNMPNVSGALISLEQRDNPSVTPVATSLVGRTIKSERQVVTAFPTYLVAKTTTSAVRPATQYGTPLEGKTTTLEARVVTPPQISAAVGTGLRISFSCSRNFKSPRPQYGRWLFFVP